MLRVLVAPNAFKGCLSSVEAARALARGVRAAGARPVLLPISDGGDGLIDALAGPLGARRVRIRATGPLGERRRAEFALSGRTAIIEMARASGLALVPKGRLDPLRATSFGTGELVRAALDRGARRLVLGLGGSATNDGGAGLAQALGARLLDGSGRELERGAAALLRLRRIDARGLDRRLRGAEILVVSDVDNPLLGPRGSARVFGPQKGATPAMVRTIERALARWAAVLKRDLGRDVARVPGAGAAGGLGSGLLSLLGAKIVPGADWVLRRIGAAGKVRACDLVLTGEGRVDRQSFYGKAPVELARLAKSLGRPAVVVCGRLDPAVKPRLARAGIVSAVELARGRSPEEAMSRCDALLSDAASRLVSRVVRSAREKS